MRTFSRVVASFLAACASLFVGGGAAHAGLDNEMSQPDHQGRMLTIQQWNTLLQDVPALDRNRLTREWFHSGKATYTVDGKGAESFAGKLELGYQVGFPWTLSVGINFTYSTPNILLDDADVSPVSDGFNPFGSVISTNLIPQSSVNVDLGNGPQVEEVATFSVDVSGAKGSVVVSNAHGTVTGIAGGLLLRPYARLISNDGDSVTTYGEPRNMG
ncbi:MspA family porin [Mycobacterium sp. 21AC1]|uniref:MspA family porin n=1 Tax=[Mycobacterium] appelbergii TaxID=2939269 RepID=UPI0029392FD2|nr:MspA family porin [Mycobacterium sp. 21AC1]MDV3128210.1 MspA family porin [Mycobacterium sp. 21AC1]